VSGHARRQLLCCIACCCWGCCVLRGCMGGGQGRECCCAAGCGALAAALPLPHTTHLDGGVRQVWHLCQGTVRVACGAATGDALATIRRRCSWSGAQALSARGDHAGAREASLVTRQCVCRAQGTICGLHCPSSLCAARSELLCCINFVSKRSIAVNGGNAGVCAS
jgi:hypothetical protein